MQNLETKMINDEDIRKVMEILNKVLAPYYTKEVEKALNLVMEKQIEESALPKCD